MRTLLAILAFMMAAFYFFGTETITAGTTYCHCPSLSAYFNKPSCENDHGVGRCSGPYALANCSTNCIPY
jgi:hypothetical protein